MHRPHKAGLRRVRMEARWLIELQRRHRHGGGTGGKNSGLDTAGLLMEATMSTSAANSFYTPDVWPSS